MNIIDMALKRLSRILPPAAKRVGRSDGYERIKDELGGGNRLEETS
jgi:hypothetical protein